MVPRAARIPVVLAMIIGGARVEAQETHVVPLAQLQARQVDASRQREKDLDAVNDLLSNPAVAKVLDRAKVDESKLKEAVSQLSSEELGKLAARARKIQSNVATGSLSHKQWTYLAAALGISMLVLALILAT